VWPFYSYYETDEVKELEVLGPFFVWRQTDEVREWGLRPFIYRTEKPSADYELTEYLYPLGRYERMGDDEKSYLIPLSLRKQETYPAQGEQATHHTFLAAFWGETESGERYSGFFPFTGTMKGRFARDEITFHLWPLYSRIVRGDEVTYRIPWPFVSVTKGSAEGVSLWPLWGYKIKEGVYSRGFLLWPFYVYTDVDLDTENPIRRRYYLPFYAFIRSPRTTVDMILPPLFFHQHSDEPSLDRWEFWPFITWVDGDDVLERRVFPFFRSRQEPDKRREFFLWPLCIREWDRYGTEERCLLRFLLINRHRVIRDTQSGEYSVATNLWPLFDYRRDSDGAVHFHVFSLFPLQHDGPERTIYPLFWIYRYVRSSDGCELADLLWGLFRHRRTPRGSSTQIAFLLRTDRWGEEDTQLSLLLGLFRYRRTPTEDRVQLFGVDVWRWER